MLRAVFTLLLLVGASHALADDALWSRLRDGPHAVLIRHAHAPGSGDPAGFRLDDCATQRNLSREGREQAAALGAAFRARKVAVTRVLSSRWCRALDTARIAFGKATPEPALDSFFGRPERRAAQTESLRNIVKDAGTREGTLVLVTHQVNITALTGISAAEGEIVVVSPRGDAIVVVGRLAL